MNQRLTFRQTQLLQHCRHSFRTENAHQIVFHRQEKLGCARVALTTGAAAQLIVDTAAFVPFGAENVKSAGSNHLFLVGFALKFDFLFHPLDLLRRFVALELRLQTHVRVAAELDVGTAAGHIGGNRNRARHARLSNDRRFAFVMTRVQHLKFNVASGFQHVSHQFRLFDRSGADQNRLPLGVAFQNGLDDGVIFLFRRTINFVMMIHALNRPVGRNLNTGKIVNVAELGFFRHCRTGHARQLGIKTEIILESD